MREVTLELERIFKLSHAPHVEPDIQKTENIMVDQATSSMKAFLTSMTAAELEGFIITH
jgi:hypothetical protein